MMICAFLQAVLVVKPDLPLEDVLKSVISRLSEDSLTFCALHILRCIPQVQGSRWRNDYNCSFPNSQPSG